MANDTTDLSHRPFALKFPREGHSTNIHVVVKLLTTATHVPYLCRCLVKAGQIRLVQDVRRVRIYIARIQRLCLSVDIFHARVIYRDVARPSDHCNCDTTREERYFSQSQQIYICPVSCRQFAVLLCPRFIIGPFFLLRFISKIVLLFPLAEEYFLCTVCCGISRCEQNPLSLHKIIVYVYNFT